MYRGLTLATRPSSRFVARPVSPGLRNRRWTRRFPLVPEVVAEVLDQTNSLAADFEIGLPPIDPGQFCSPGGVENPGVVPCPGGWCEGRRVVEVTHEDGRPVPALERSGEFPH